MTTNIVHILVLACLLTLAGCSGKRQATNPDNEQWFCQSNVAGDGWECVQDNRLAENPIPTRLPPEPQPPQSEIDSLGWDTPESALDSSRNVLGTEQMIADEAVEVTTVDQLTATADGVEITPIAGSAEAAKDNETMTTDASAIETTAAPAEGDFDSELPKHVRLAYVPPEPTPIMQLNPEYYAVQLLAMDTKAQIENFISDNDLLGMSAAAVENDGATYYVLILGIYETYAIAREAATDLPPPLDGVTPWIRPLGELQQAMARADSSSADPDQDRGESESDSESESGDESEIDA